MASALVIQQELKQVDPADIMPYPDVNPRRYFDAEEQAKLEQSIAGQGGNIEPGVITEGPGAPDGPEWWLVTGERRWRACKAKGLKFNAVFRPGLSYQEAIELAGVENLVRTDLNAIEEARWIEKLIDPKGGQKTQAEVAEIRCVDQSTISNTLRLLELPENIQDLIGAGKLAPTNARDLLLPWMKEDEAIREKFFRIVAQQLDFGVTTGQHMSKPWLKEMVERVGKIAKPAPAPKPAPKTTTAAPAKKEAPKPEPEKPAAPVAEEKAEAGEAPGKAEPEETPPAEAAPAAAESPAEKETPAETPPAPPAEPIEVDLDAGAFAAATQIVGGEHHHITFAVMPHANRPGSFSVIVSPKSQKGMPSIASESAIGTAETIEDEVRAALGRLVAKINDGRE